MPGRHLRIVLAEDAALLREGLAGILERAGHDVVAAVGDADALLAYVDRDRPDVVITDIRMPPGHSDEGLRAAASIRERHPGIAILVLSAYIADAYVPDLLDSAPGGGVGYLLKDRVAGGGTVIDPDVVRGLLSRRRDDGPLAALTDREREVLALMAEGRTNGSIADTLVVSEAAVRKHVGNIFAKLALPEGQDRRVSAVLAYLRRS